MLPEEPKMPVDERWKEAFRRVKATRTNEEIENMTNEELAKAVQEELQRMDADLDQQH